MMICFLLLLFAVKVDINAEEISITVGNTDILSTTVEGIKYENGKLYLDNFISSERLVIKGIDRLEIVVKGENRIESDSRVPFSSINTYVTFSGGGKLVIVNKTQSGVPALYYGNESGCGACAIGMTITDKTEVGYYGQTDKIIRTVLSIITSLNIVMIPRMANKFANVEDNYIRKNILTSFKFTFFLAMPMMLGLIAIAKDFMPWFLGEGFENSIYITYAMSPIILVIGLGNLIGNQYLLPISKQRQYTIAIVIGAITNVILNFILIPKFAAIGAAIATVIAEAVVTGIQFYYIRKDHDLKYVWNMSIKYIISSIIMAICVIVANILLLSNVSVLIRIIVDIIVGTTIYLLILVIMKDEFLKQILNKAYKIKYICNKINKKF